MGQKISKHRKDYRAPGEDIRISAEAGETTETSKVWNFTVYIDRVAWRRYPRLIWRDGDRFVSILWGINISGGKVEPRYLALVHAWRGGGYAVIEFPMLLITIRRRTPYLTVEWTKKLEAE